MCACVCALCVCVCVCVPPGDIGGQKAIDAWLHKSTHGPRDKRPKRHESGRRATTVNSAGLRVYARTRARTHAAPPAWAAISCSPPSPPPVLQGDEDGECETHAARVQAHSTKALRRAYLVLHHAGHVSPALVLAAVRLAPSAPAAAHRTNTTVTLPGNIWPERDPGWEPYIRPPGLRGILERGLRGAGGVRVGRPDDFATGARWLAL